MPSEQALIPYQAATTVTAASVLVLAPHPDDEVFGCGGAIAQHVAQGCVPRVIVLTDGAAGGDASTRQSECRAAARTLGCGEPEFWNLPDRGLYATADLAQRLAEVLSTRGVDLVYAPSPFEVHPDHRQTTALLGAALARHQGPLRVAFYEVGSPLPQPNLLLDITPWLARKHAAAMCFGSQLEAQDYAEQIDGLARYRSYTLPRTVRAAEAYLMVSSTDLRRGTGYDLALSESVTWEHIHQPGTAAGAPARPLVTVVVRSVGRPLLHEALDSLARQTWSEVEVLVVSAVAEHPPLPPRCGPHAMRLVGTGEALARSRAANVGLDHARGDYLLFLDDDDWLMPSHLARLVGTLHGQSLWQAAYTGVLMVDADNRPLGQTFDLPFDPLRQRAGNLTPIHAVMFHRSLLDQGCRFDEALDRYEDWDFWLQVATRTAMAHVPGVSAAYRIHPSSGVHEDAGTASASTAVIHEKWQSSWTDRQKQEVMTRVWAYDEQTAALARESLARIAAEQQLAQQTEQHRVTAQAMEVQVLDLSAQLKELGDMKERLSSELRTATGRVSTLQSELQASDASRDALQRTLNQTNARLQSLETDFRSLETDFRSLEADFRALDAEHQALAVQHLALQAGRDALDIELQAMRQSRRALQVEVDAMRRSRSWRLTAPLRRLGAVEKAMRQALGPAGRAAARQVYADGGMRAVWTRVRHRIAASASSRLDYAEWVRRHDSPDAEQLERWRLETRALPARPLISIVMPVYDPPLDLLQAALDSVAAQVYDHWELCICDDASIDPAVWTLLQARAAADPRFRIKRRLVNGHIAAASNDALALAGGEWIAWMDHDDMLAPQALLRVVQVVVRRPDAGIVYSDEDKTDGRQRFAPYFKPDWNETLFLGQNLINHLAVYRAGLVRAVGGLRAGFDGAQDYDLALRCIEQVDATQILHLPEVLYHWRSHAASTARVAGAKAYAVDAATRALSEHLTRSGLAGAVELLPFGHLQTTPFATHAIQDLSLLIIGGDAAAQAALPVGLADPGIVEIVQVPADAASISRAVAQARGRHVALLRAGLQPLASDALQRLWRFGQMSAVGIVAGAIRDGRGRLRGSGLVLNPRTLATTLYAGLPAGHPGTMGRAVLAQEMSAVMLDVCVVRRESFVEAGGLDCAPGIEAAVSLCLRLRERGCKAVWCPPSVWRDPAGPAGAAWGHCGDESVSRRMLQQYPGFFATDPAYHRALDEVAADFSLRAGGPRPWPGATLPRPVAVAADPPTGGDPAAGRS